VLRPSLDPAIESRWLNFSGHRRVRGVAPVRHTYAAELARERTPINVIRDALGHTSLAVTDRYLRDVAPMHVIDTIRARRWESA